MSFLGRDVQRDPLRAFLETIETRLPGSGIFGGMVRDFGLDHIKYFSSDIDVVCTASAKEIYEAIKNFDPCTNKYGGFRFRYSGRVFDIWSLNDTWAVREGYVSADCLADLRRTTFFNLDAAVFLLDQKKVIVSKDYETKLGQRLLDINLKSHPSPERMAARSISMAIKKNLSLSPELCEFVLENVQSGMLCRRHSHFVDEMRSHIRRKADENFSYDCQLEMWATNSVPKKSMSLTELA